MNNLGETYNTFFLKREKNKANVTDDPRDQHVGHGRSMSLLTIKLSEGSQDRRCRSLANVGHFVGCRFTGFARVCPLLSGIATSIQFC